MDHPSWSQIADPAFQDLNPGVSGRPKEAQVSQQTKSASTCPPALCPLTSQDQDPASGKARSRHKETQEQLRVQQERLSEEGERLVEEQEGGGWSAQSLG